MQGRYDSFDECEFSFAHNKDWNIDVSNISHHLPPPTKTNIAKYDAQAHIINSIIPDGAIVALEGYAMGATGQVFNIAENTAILKHTLYKRGINVVIVPPTELKKHATGKGNADKDKMEEAFIQKTGVDIKQILNTKQLSPANDMIDAFWLADYVSKCWMEDTWHSL